MAVNISAWSIRQPLPPLVIALAVVALGFLSFNKLPITPNIPYHSIIGDRGRGDTPNSSDGIVPYWSSHLDGAKSELIVHSGHGAQYDPEAIREVERILKENLTDKN